MFHAFRRRFLVRDRHCTRETACPRTRPTGSMRGSLLRTAIFARDAGITGPRLESDGVPGFGTSSLNSSNRTGRRKCKKNACGPRGRSALPCGMLLTGPGLTCSRGIMSVRGMKPSAFLHRSTIAGRSTRVTPPLTSWDAIRAVGIHNLGALGSRTFWTMTCFADGRRYVESDPTHGLLLRTADVHGRIDGRVRHPDAARLRDLKLRGVCRRKSSSAGKSRNPRYASIGDAHVPSSPVLLRVRDRRAASRARR